jgi:hypothetical protein
MPGYNFGELIKTIGEVMVGITAIMVHRRVWKEHKINEKVRHEMMYEQVIGFAGIALIIVGFLLSS